MVVGVFGVPSVFSALGAHLIRILLAHAYGECEVISTATLEDLKTLWPRKNVRSVICYNELPHASLIRLFLEENIPLIAFANTFRATAQGLACERGLSPLDAIRTTSLSMSALEEVVTAKKVLIIRSDSKQNEIRHLLNKIAHFLGFTLPSANLETLVNELSFKRNVQGGISFADQQDLALMCAGITNTFDSARAQEIDALSDHLTEYDEILEYRHVHSLRWHGSLFHLLDKNAGPAIEAVDLTAPARYLVSGPYMGLPRGRWVAVPSFSVAGNLSGNKLLIDVTTNRGADVIAKGQAIMPSGGAYTFELAFETTQSHLPIELRFFLLQGAIEGKFNFSQVFLTRH